MGTFLLERERIRVEEACDAIKLALEEAGRDEIVFPTGEGPLIWDEVAELARKVGYEAKLSGRTLTVQRGGRGRAIIAACASPQRATRCDAQPSPTR